MFLKIILSFLIAMQSFAVGPIIFGEPMKRKPSLETVKLDPNSAKCANLVEYLSRSKPRLKRLKYYFPNLDEAQIERLRLTDFQKLNINRSDFWNYDRVSGQKRFEIVQKIINGILDDEAKIAMKGNEELVFYEVDKVIQRMINLDRIHDRQRAFWSFLDYGLVAFPAIAGLITFTVLTLMEE